MRGARRRAPTRAHPAPGSPFLLALDSPRPDCVRPLPQRGRGSEAPLLGATLFRSLGGLGAVRKVSRSRALRRNCRCRSLLTPAATMPRQVPPSLRKGVSGNGPDLPCRATLPAVAVRFPHSWRVPASSVCRPAGHNSQAGEAGSGHLPAAHSSFRAVTFHPGIR